LNEHFLKENKNRSIFRKNIGRCILNKDKSPYLPVWEYDITSRAEKERHLHLLNLDFERQIETRISDYIRGNLSFCVFQVDTKEQRLFWETRIVSTLARSNELKSSKDWLGNYSTKDKIRAVGLWQVNKLFNDQLTEREFEDLKRMVSDHSTPARAELEEAKMKWLRLEIQKGLDDLAAGRTSDGAEVMAEFAEKLAALKQQ
jgi:predicted transcriptional regulator